MCVSNHFIEQEAYDFCEKIRKQSLYKFIGTECRESPFEHEEGIPLISKIVLEDKEGSLYYVVPNPNGLKFAKQEITYKEYKRLEQNETRNAFALFFVILGFFGGTMITFLKFFT